MHHGQGKWYPGEELPRWAWSAYWRKDGKAIWQNPDLFADPAASGSDTAEDAKALLSEIAKGLGIDDNLCFAAYEDPWYYSWRERRLPSNVDPLKSNLDDPRERERLTKVFRQGLGNAVGQVLPSALIKWMGAGAAVAGSCARNTVSSCPAIPHSVFACPSTARRGRFPKTTCRCGIPIQAPPPRRRSPRKKNLAREK